MCLAIVEELQELESLQQQVKDPMANFGELDFIDLRTELKVPEEKVTIIDFGHPTDYGQFNDQLPESKSSFMVDSIIANLIMAKHDLGRQVKFDGPMEGRQRSLGLPYPNVDVIREFSLN